MLSNTKSNIDQLNKLRGKIYSSKGGWVIGKGVFNQGYDMMNDLVGKCTYMQVIVLNATGRLPEKRVADWFEATHICLSWPDPRIWCNQIGALAGSVRTSVIAATCAGLLANDSRTYGTKPLHEGVQFMQYAMNQSRNGLSVEEIVGLECKKHGGKPNIMGYARPIAKGDERIPAMERTQEELGIPYGEHQKMAYAMEKVIKDQFDESMNINGYMSSFLADHGYSPTETYRIFSILVNSGITACYVDTMEKPEETFFPLQCEDIKYTGKPHRDLP
jgi:citrate synthase